MDKEVLNLFNPQSQAEIFDSIRISIASPQKILSWSFGEIKKPETINYRTFKPERDGLFCARIFGPTKDYECLCGKYKRMKYKGVTCEKCNVEVTLSNVRRERMGHIELACPIAHIWFLKSLPSRIGLLLDMTLKDLERVLYFENFVVVEPGLTPLKEFELLDEEQYQSAQDEYGADSFNAMIGAEAIRTMLSDIDLSQLVEDLRVEIAETSSELRYTKLSKRLKTAEAFLDSGNRPEWMIMEVIPVIPPDLRPLVPLDGGRFATSDLNDLYRRVINRNNRLKKLMDLRAPDIIVRNEKRMLQESVDALFDNGRRGRTITGNNKRPLKSLSDMLKGKQGRFRQNLLGKRVDYSGRSVIVVGPELKLHQCGLPKKMALELFKPFIYARLDAKGYSSTVKQAKKLVERERPEVWDILDEVIREHPVLLNRAPTLHRLGIQAFEPVLIEGKAIQLHPLVCAAFNADFDGDQMAVHVPLSLEAQLEARVLMMSTNNILHPANGQPIIVPSQDIVLGLYYLSIEAENEPGEGMMFANLGELHHAIDNGIVSLHTKIKGRFTTVDSDGNPVSKVYDTTPGRMLIGEHLPRRYGISYDIVNHEMTNKNISAMIDRVYRHCGQKETVIFADQIMNLGFSWACKAGISFGKDDMVIPEAKHDTVARTQEEAKGFEQQYTDGLITQREKYNKVVDAWSKCSNQVAEDMMTGLQEKIFDDEGRQKQMNSIYMMSHSGARGSPTQMKQLAGMRGLMATPSGEIIETPIISNFKEGLTVMEYFNSTHGARKGLTDTALKTANSGYLTRRLVDVAQDCIINEVDCGTDNGLMMRAIIDAGQVIVSLSHRITGRCAAEDIIHPESGDVLIEAGGSIEESDALLIEESGIQQVKIRSALTCETRTGICSVCYGRDLARGTPVNLSEAVGVIAAQSIGEPGTQLTMRTFHIGGSANVGDSSSFIESSFEGNVKLRNRDVVRNSHDQLMVMGRNMAIVLEDDKGNELAVHRVGYGSRLHVDDGDKVVHGDRLAEWDLHTRPILSSADGKVVYEDLVVDESMKEEVNEETGVAQRVVIDATVWVVDEEKEKDTKREKKSTKKQKLKERQSLKPALLVSGSDGKVVRSGKGGEARFLLSVDTILTVGPGTSVKAGDIIARVPLESTKSKDITGGLPRVAELFEARVPGDAAIMADRSGTIRFKRDYKNKRRIEIEPTDNSLEPIEHLIPKSKPFHYQDGDSIEKGDYIQEGNPSPHDILDVKGVEALASYLVDEVQEVYRLQGVGINDKHIEVIVRQMLQKVEITDPGESGMVRGEQMDRIELDLLNERLVEEGRGPVSSKPVLLGITKAALQTRSFISAASFQETTKVLTEAAITGKYDTLEGLKENVIVGRLIPAGTGGVMNQIRRIANSRDDLIIDAHRKEAEALAALEAPDSKESAPAK